MKIFRLKRQDDTFESLTKDLRLHCIDILNEMGEKTRNLFSVYCNFGELGSLDILESCYNSPYCKEINIIVGPKIKNTVIAGKLIALIEKQNKDLQIHEQGHRKINIFVLKDRPERHSYLIKNLIVYEDQHEPTSAPDWVTVVVNPSESIVREYIETFNQKKKCALSRINSAEDIRAMGTYS